jgi:hypothetical protein
MLYSFFRVIPRRLNFMCRRFGTLWLSHLHRWYKTCLYRLWRWKENNIIIIIIIIYHVCEWYYNYIPAKNTILRYIMLWKKSKAVPEQVWSDPEGSRRLTLQDFKKSAQNGGKFVSPTHLPPLTPTKYSWYSSVRGWVDPRATVRPEGIEPATSQLAAQCLNQQRHRVTRQNTRIWRGVVYCTVPPPSYAQMFQIRCTLLVNLDPIHAILKNEVKITIFCWFSFLHTFLTLIPSADVCLSNFKIYVTWPTAVIFMLGATDKR